MSLPRPPKAIALPVTLNLLIFGEMRLQNHATRERREEALCVTKLTAWRSFARHESHAMESLSIRNSMQSLSIRNRASEPAVSAVDFREAGTDADELENEENRTQPKSVVAVACLQVFLIAFSYSIGKMSPPLPCHTLERVLTFFLSHALSL